jgi:hypothetical protein
MKFTITDVLLTIPALIVLAVLFIMILVKYRASSFKVIRELWDWIIAP